MLYLVEVFDDCDIFITKTEVNVNNNQFLKTINQVHITRKSGDS